MEVDLAKITLARHNLNGIVKKTPCMYNESLSKNTGANVYLKREDLQDVRSYKIRGAFSLISGLSPEDKNKGIVCSSAGNHAQGVAFACKKLGIKGTIFMPVTTPKQKANKTKKFGEGYVDVNLVGDTFDDASKESMKFADKTGAVFVHPFNDPRVIAGQGTIAHELFEQLQEIDYIIVPVGGGGLIAGIGTYIKEVSPKTKIIGVEPKGAASMTEALKHGKPVELETITKFIDGASVKKVGDKSFEIAKKVIDNIFTVPQGAVCSSIMELFNNEGIVAEPAGAMSIAALNHMDIDLKNKNVVCILSGGNNDWGRLSEIEEKSLLYEELKHYLLIDFPQRPGALREFLDNILGPNDDIVRFEYLKKTNREFGPALVGLKVNEPKDFENIRKRLKEKGINYFEVKNDKRLFEYLV
ncbi:MAG: threonine ammonia-lyase IlvA [Candidatus Nanoarchaeia archaeon]